jgi:peptidoglycan/LPS O-acetylase OafA/YrhL
MTHLRYDQCAVGVILAAIATFAPRSWAFLSRALVGLVPLAIMLALANLYWRIAHVPRADWEPLVWTAIFATFIVLANSNDFWRSSARIPGARYVADRAYAVYLLHVEAIALIRRIAGMHDGHIDLPLTLYLVLVWIVVLILAEVLYRVVERPFMRAREWFSPSRSRHVGVVAPVALN